MLSMLCVKLCVLLKILSLFYVLYDELISHLLYSHTDMNCVAIRVVAYGTESRVSRFQDLCCTIADNLIVVLFLHHIS